MAIVFTRLLRLRSLVEEAARTDLERQAMQVARVDRALRREADVALRLHTQSLASLLASGGTAATPGRIETEAQREERFLAQEEWGAGRLGRSEIQRMAEQEARRLSVRRDEFLARRKERRQVEILLQTEVRRRRVNETRREQREIDDLFAASRARLRRLEGKR
jgi:flagellar biosynthesis chaperone FliJ